MQNTRACILSLICLLIGVFIYAFFRSDILFIEKLHIVSSPINTLDTSNPIVYWIVYCLPDGLWYLALLIVQYLLFIQESLISRICAVVAILLPFVIEILQALGWFSGTFDWYDMLTYILTLILFLYGKKKVFTD